MKKFVAIILSLIFVFSCAIPVFAADTFEDKDKVVEITIDNPFGDEPIVVDFGFNKYFDKVEDFIPRYEINGFSDIQIYSGIWDIIRDVIELTIHVVQNAINTTLFPCK